MRTFTPTTIDYRDILRTITLSLSLIPAKFVIHCYLVYNIAPILCGSHFSNITSVLLFTACLWFLLTLSGVSLLPASFVWNKIHRRFHRDREEADEYKRQRQAHLEQSKLMSCFRERRWSLSNFFQTLKKLPWQLYKAFVSVWILSLFMPEVLSSKNLLALFEFSLCLAVCDLMVSTLSWFMCISNGRSTDRLSGEDQSTKTKGPIEVLNRLQEQISVNYGKLDLEIQINPTPEAYFERGNKHLEFLELIPAIDDFDQAIELKSNFAEAFEKRADAFVKLHLPKLASRDYDEGCRLFFEQAKPSDYRRTADKKLGLGLKSSSTPPTVISAFVRLITTLFAPSKALTADADELSNVTSDLEGTIQTATLYARQAELLYSNSDYAGALQACEKAIEVNSESAVAYRLRGQIYTQLLQSELAIKSFDQAISLDPRDSVSYEGRANINLLVCNYKAVVDDCTVALSFSMSYQLRLLRGKAYAAKGDHVNALADLTDFIDTWNQFISLWDWFWIPLCRQIADGLREQLIDAYQHRALVHEHLGELDKAARDLTCTQKVRSKIRPMRQVAGK